ncbi:MAG: PH-domain-containing protein [Monoraphidium minutum]|nr:MAG: PH-domain-containing protein [Monoraphidium minutum]
MAALFGARKVETDVEFWHNPDRSGWLMKQGEYIKTWRRRWFVLKQGKIFWFKSDVVTPDSVPRGVIEVKKCLSIKGAEDTINKPHAFEISTTDDNMFFIADSDKEKEDWINAVGRAIVKHSRSLLDNDQADYTTQ